MATILLSNSLLTRQTFRLDHYGPEILREYSWLVQEENGHQYYYFPIGTSIFSTPAVLLAKIAGIDVLAYQDRLQLYISMVVGMLTIGFLFSTACLVRRPREAFLIVATLWFGTPLVSTMGSALWSHNFGVLFASVVIYQCVRCAGNNRRWPALLIGTLLFSAYLCRPTMAVFSLCAILFIFLHNRKAALKTAGVVIVLVLVFSAWSYHELGRILPEYYQPDRLSSNHWLTAVFGNLVSPSRGLLVFSPFLLLVMITPGKFDSSFFRHYSWIVFPFVWPLLHLAVISNFSHWWGGHAFGPRLMTDVIPGMLLLMMRWWPMDYSRKRERIVLPILVVSVITAVYINTRQGLFNKYTAVWNAEPNIDFYQFYLFDWRYPQFLYSRENHSARLAEHRALPKIRIQHDHEDRYSWPGWAAPEPEHRWSSSREVNIEFHPNGPAPKLGYIIINANYYGTQRVRVFLNGHLLGRYVAHDYTHPRTIKFDPELLLGSERNTLRFVLPDAKYSGGKDPRQLALALRYMEIL